MTFPFKLFAEPKVTGVAVSIRNRQKVGWDRPPIVFGEIGTDIMS